MIVLLPQENADLPRTSALSGAGFLAASLGAGTGGVFYFRHRTIPIADRAHDVRLRDLGAIAYHLGVESLANVVRENYFSQAITSFFLGILPTDFTSPFTTTAGVPKTP